MSDTATLEQQVVGSDAQQLRHLGAAQHHAGPVQPHVLHKGRVSAPQAALSRMVGRGLHVRLPALDAEFRLHLSQDDPAWTQSLVLSGSAGMVEISDGARLMRALTGIDLDALSKADPDSRNWFLAAAAGRLAGTPLACMDRIVQTAKTAFDTSSDASTLRLSLHGGHHAMTTHARAATATWQHVLSSGAWLKMQSPLLPYMDFHISHTVCLARHCLPASALGQLAAGDIVLPDSPQFACDGNGSMHLAGVRWRVRYQSPAALEIIALENELDTEELDESFVVQADVTDQDDPLDQGDQHNNLATLPLTLVFELGKISLSLADLRALGPQAILTVTAGSPALIAIVCSGRRLGSGEAVDVDGALGIRITHWGDAMVDVC